MAIPKKINKDSDAELKKLQKELDKLKAKHAEVVASLKESDEKFYILFETAAEELAIHQNGKLVEVNQSCCKAFGYKREELIGQELFSFIHPEFHDTVIRKVQNQDTSPYEIMMIRKSKEAFWVKLESRNIIYNGIPSRITAIRDINAIKESENRIIENERRFSVLSNNFPGIAYRCKLDEQLTMEFLSQGFLDLTGYRPKDFINNKKYAFNDIIHPEDKGNEKLNKALKAKKVYELEYRIVTASGEVKWVWEKGQGVFDIDGKLLFLEGFITDINEKKKYEIELKQSRENYKKLFDYSPDGVVVHVDGRILFSNQAALKMMSLNSVEELKNKSVLDFILPEFHSFTIERMKLGKQGKELDFAEIKIKSFTGEVKLIETKPMQIEFDGLPATQVIFRDITVEKELLKEQLRAQVAEEANQKLQKEINQRIKTEHRLENNQKYTRLLIESSLDMICAADKKGFISEFNTAAQETFGYTLDEIIGKPITILYANPNQRMHVTQNELIGKGIFVGEVVNVKKNGEQFISFLSASVLRNDDGEIVGSMGVSRDVTESKRAEQELKNSEERYRTIFNQAFVGIAKVSLQGQFLQVNQQLCNILGYTEEELYTKGFMDITVPEDMHLSVNFWDELLNGSIEKATFIKRYSHKNKKIIIVNLTISLVKASEGNPSHFITVYQDITEIRNAEKEQQAQAAKLNAIFESGSHLIWTADKNACLTSFNQNFKNFVRQQYQVDVHAGISLMKGKMVSNDMYNSFWMKKFENTFTGTPQYFETKFVNESGANIWYEIFLNPIFDGNKEVVEISAIGHDITEKIAANEKIQQSLQEKEVLLKEVHHRVKNNLQVISSILNLQSSYVKDQNTLNILKESQNRIKSMAFIHESLYQTKDFSNINFSEYIINLSRNLVNTYSDTSRKIKLIFDVETIFLNLDLAIPSGLIINEIVSNSIKYAFGKKDNDDKITIAMHTEGELLKLVVSDNGIGMPKNIDFRNTESLGLQLVVTLVDQINGDIQIDNSKGTQYTIKFKQNQIKNRI